jgi:hypothetical protein
VSPPWQQEDNVSTIVGSSLFVSLIGNICFFLSLSLSLSCLSHFLFTSMLLHRHTVSNYPILVDEIPLSSHPTALLLLCLCKAARGDCTDQHRQCGGCYDSLNVVDARAAVQHVILRYMFRKSRNSCRQPQHHIFLC